MLSGNDALLRIDRAVDELRKEADSLKARVAALGQREVALRGEMRQALEELARFRLEDSRAGAVAESAAGVGREVDRLLAERTLALEAMTREVEAAGARIAELDAGRASASAAAQAESERLDRAEAALQAELDADAGHKAQDEKADAADAVAREAEHKHGLAAEDRRVKGAPYEADPLFMYLWSRGYGTSAYGSTGLVRFLDRWVARLVRFEDARRNYRLLTDIPDRLKEHAERMRARASEEIEALAALEAQARHRTEIPAIAERLAAAKARIAATDSEIVTAREAMKAAEERSAVFERGEDEGFRKALSVMVDAMDDQDLAELRREARRTRMPEDDRIVETLVALEDEIEEVVGEREDAVTTSRSTAARLTELEDMRVEFRRRGYDDYGSGFSDGGLFAMILTEFLRGAINAGTYWDRLDRGHRRQPRESKPDFGSGRYRFPGPLTFPGSTDRGGGGGRSRGGFRTGGGMGRGGGFRTGGGF